MNIWSVSGLENDAFVGFARIIWVVALHEQHIVSVVGIGVGVCSCDNTTDDETNEGEDDREGKSESESEGEGGGEVDDGVAITEVGINSSGLNVQVCSGIWKRSKNKLSS